jgi:hypothetical protein
MVTEFELRQKVRSLETKVWVYGIVFPVVFGVLALVVGSVWQPI